MSAITPNFDGIPDELQNRPQWVVWKLEPRDGQPKPAKVPYNVRKGKMAKTNAPETWTTFSEARDAYERGGYAGIGYVFSAEDPFTGIDLDHCRDPETGELTEEARVITASLWSYTEVSQSGTGVHCIVEAKLPHNAWNRVKLTPPAELEMYDAGRFFVCTGMTPNGKPPRAISACQEIVDKLQTKYRATPPPPVAAPPQRTLQALNLDDEKLLAKAMAASNGGKFKALWDGDTSDYGGDASAADMALASKLAFWTSRDAPRMDRLFRQSSLLRPKWDERRGAETYGERTIRKAIEGCAEVYGLQNAIGSPLTSPRATAPSTGKAERLKLAHLDMAQSCIADFGPGNLIYALGDYWRWDASGVWRRTDPLLIKQSVHRLFPAEIKSAHTVNSILELAKTEAFMDGRTFIPPEGRAINCRSGLLRWNGKDWELRRHRREDYATAQIPVEYEPNEQAPRFEQFLSEVFKGDEDSEEKAVLICEMLGYSLLASCEFEKFILLVGAGANGKSVLLNTLAALVGCENACAVQPSQFDNRFQRAHLQGKLVNIVSEIAEGAEIADAQLKAIVSGELTTAEHKLKPPFDFRPYSTCWFGTNHMPHTRDFSQALFRRAVVIPFNRVFAEHEQDKVLCQKLKAELSGILNLALEAMAGVFERGIFTLPESSIRACQEWRIQADQVAQFAEDCCHFGPGLAATSKEVFERYKGWAEEAGIVRKLNRKNFTDRMVRLGAAIHRGTGGSRSLLGVEVAA